MQESDQWINSTLCGWVWRYRNKPQEAEKIPFCRHLPLGEFVDQYTQRLEVHITLSLQLYPPKCWVKKEKCFRWKCYAIRKTWTWDLLLQLCSSFEIPGPLQSYLSQHIVFSCSDRGLSCWVFLLHHWCRNAGFTQHGGEWFWNTSLARTISIWPPYHSKDSNLALPVAWETWAEEIDTYSHTNI